MSSVRFRELARDEMREILSRNHVGRIAFARGSQVEIIPVHYVHANDWIYGRTAPGGRLEQAGETWWPVAFEVDEIEGLFDWRSVVVRGGLYIIRPEGAEWEKQAWLEGLGHVRKLIPDAYREEDPVPERTSLFRIAVQEVTGREATSA